MLFNNFPKLNTFNCTFVLYHIHMYDHNLSIVNYYIGSPSSVTDLVVPPNKITPTSFVAQWSKPSSSPVCGPVQYMVTVSTTGGVVISNRTINRTTFTATNLSDNTQYKINITAINKGGNGISASAETTTRNGGKCTHSVMLYIQSKDPFLFTL